MSTTNSLHYQLCCEGAKYIIQPRAKEPYQTQNMLSTVELVCYGTEQTDVYATNRETSTIIEVKTSHADFLNDKKKYARSEEAELNGHQMGNYRYYLCPKGIISTEELPEGWGLLEWNGKKIEKVKSSKKFETNQHFDVFLLCSIIARECGTHKIFNYRNKESEKMTERLHAVLNGADIIEDCEREKINSWDVMLETKDEISKNYSNLLNNPKVKAVINGADAIEWPSEEEIGEKATELGDKFSKDVEVASFFACCAEMMASWLKSKIVK